MAIVVRLQHHHIHLILNLQNENKNKMLNRLSFLSENDDRLKCFHTLFKCNICVAQCNNSICFSAHNSNSLKPSIHRHFSII